MIDSLVKKFRRFSQTPITKEIFRSTPNPTLETDPLTQMQLLKAFDEQQAARGLGSYGIRVRENIPSPDVVEDVLKGKRPKGGASQYASAVPFYPDKNTGLVDINPNTDRAFFAHELGHHSAAQKGFGKQVNDLRTLIVKSPKLREALTHAAKLGPLTASVLIPGSGDMAAALAIGLAPNVMTLTNEAQATLHGLDLMKRAGQPATLGQRGRLAGSFMSYATPGLIYGLGGNIAGNIFDRSLFSEESIAD